MATQKLNSVVLILAFSFLAANPALLEAKEIVKADLASVNRLLIRVDGLACYFCAYGLERYFKKSGRIAAFDMHMESGVVEATPLRGKPIPTYGALAGYVHDAGFSFRSVRVLLLGRLVVKNGGVLFVVSESGEELPVRSNSVLRGIVASETLLSAELRILATGERTDGAAMALSIESASPRHAVEKGARDGTQSDEETGDES